MSHGSSKAAWTAVLVALVGITVGGVAMIPTPNWIVFTIGCVIALAAGPIALVMSAAGLGGDRAAGHTDTAPQNVDSKRPLTSDR